MEVRRGLTERSGAAPTQEGAGEPSTRAGPAPGARFLDRLPEKLGRDLVYLKTADHYVEAFTTAGSTLVLMRFVDAVAELDGAGGLRVHRSYWVARSHVTGAARQEGRHDAASHRRPRGAGEPHLHGRRPRRWPGVNGASLDEAAVRRPPPHPGPLLPRGEERETRSAPPTFPLRPAGPQARTARLRRAPNGAEPSERSERPAIEEMNKLGGGQGEVGARDAD